MPVYEDRAPAQPDYPELEPHTILPLEVVKVTEEESNFLDDSGNKKLQVSFHFIVNDGEHKGRHLWGNTPTTWVNHENCKLRHWAQEIMGRPFESGEPLDTDDLEGAKCRGVVGIRKTSGRPFIADVMRAKGNLVEDPF